MTKLGPDFDSDERDTHEQEHVFIVGPDESNERLDLFLAGKLADVSRSQLQRLIGIGAAQVNGAPSKPSVRVATGDLVLLDLPAPSVSHMEPQDIPLDIVYEDSDLIVLNKAKGMVVHPAPGALDGTLVNALLYHCTDLSGIGGEGRPGIVHRLDKDTTGLIVAAKNDVAHNGLQLQIQRRTAKRKYLALVWGKPKFEEALIDAAIGRHPTDRRRMTVVPSGSPLAARPSQTNVRVREHLGPITFIECILQTGRTHQIRVHLSFAGHPVVGDTVYGGVKMVGTDFARGERLHALNDQLNALHGQALHAYSLSFDHPRTGERLSFEQPLPEEMANLIDALRTIQDERELGK